MGPRPNRILFKLSIYVTSAAIVSILLNLFANVFLDKSLNSTPYYILVIVLGAASIVFGILQVWPRFSVFSYTVDEQPISITSSGDSSRVRFEQTSDVTQLKPTINVGNFPQTQQQDTPVKVTMEINGTPVTIESPDVGKIEDIMKLLTQSIQASKLAEAKASQLRVKEGKETYKTESNPE